MFFYFRRTLFSVFVLACAIAILPIDRAHAAPPQMQKNQAPGYHRMLLGDFEVTALYDGYNELDPKILKGLSEKNIQSLLTRMFLEPTGPMQTAVNGYLINTGSNLVLVDTGAASCFGPTLGLLVDNLRAAGYKPEEVDTVLLTHLHADHVCGLVSADGKAVFPGATVWVAANEAAYWLSEETAAEAPEDKKALFKMSHDSVEPYAISGKLKAHTPGTIPLPGLTIVSSPGHTPGHSSYLFTSQEQNLLIWGDIVHNHAVQFSHPDTSVEFDSDQVQAVATRKKIFAEAAKNKLWIAGAHLPFPGIGHVRAETRGYTWIPIEYGPLRAEH